MIVKSRLRYLRWIAVFVFIISVIHHEGYLQRGLAANKRNMHSVITIFAVYYMEPPPFKQVLQKDVAHSPCSFPSLRDFIESNPTFYELGSHPALEGYKSEQDYNKTTPEHMSCHRFEQYVKLLKEPLGGNTLIEFMRSQSDFAMITSKLLPRDPRKNVLENGVV